MADRGYMSVNSKTDHKIVQRLFRKIVQAEMPYFIGLPGGR